MKPTAPATPSLDRDRERALALTPVSRETVERLDRYIALLLQWQATSNLIAPSTIPAIWTRHVADSLQLLDLAPAATRWVDFGSGGGFPGIVLACAMADRPGGRVTLVERNTKKAAFLREAIRVSGAAGDVQHLDIGDYVERFREPVDCVTARALAPLKVLLDYVQPLLSNGARALLQKGQDVESELTEATKYWKIDPVLHRSRVEANSWIVEIDRAEQVSAQISAKASP
jgi:16S rRNA (guanine527-N7)-methyltransferase